MSIISTHQGSLLPVRALLVATAIVLAAPIGSGLALANPGTEGASDFGRLPSAEELLSRYVEAVGGEEALSSLATRVALMHVVTDLDRVVPVHEVDTLSVYCTSSGEFLIVTRTSRGMLLEGCDGDETWKISTDGSVAGSRPQGPRDQWMTDPRFPLRMRQLFPHMDVIGMDVWGRDLVYVVDVDGDESHRLGFDVETGLLTRLGYHRELLDYEEVDGVMLPRRVVYSRKGGSTTFVLDSVSHNERLDRTIFSLAK